MRKIIIINEDNKENTDISEQKKFVPNSQFTNGSLHLFYSTYRFKNGLNEFGNQIQ